MSPLHPLPSSRGAPGGQQGRALMAEPATATPWKGLYLQRLEMIVGYQYRMPGQQGSYDLYSLGPKGAQGGEAESDELRSW